MKYIVSIFAIFISASAHCANKDQDFASFSPKTVHLSKTHKNIQYLCNNVSSYLDCPSVEQSHTDEWEKVLKDAIKKGHYSKQDICDVLNDCRIVLKKEITAKSKKALLEIGLQVLVGLFLLNGNNISFFVKIGGAVQILTLVTRGPKAFESVREAASQSCWSDDFFTELLNRIDQYNEK